VGRVGALGGERVDGRQWTRDDTTTEGVCVGQRVSQARECVHMILSGAHGDYRTRHEDRLARGDAVAGRLVADAPPRTVGHVGPARGARRTAEARELVIAPYEVHARGPRERDTIEAAPFRVPKLEVRATPQPEPEEGGEPEDQWALREATSQVRRNRGHLGYRTRPLRVSVLACVNLGVGTTIPGLPDPAWTRQSSPQCLRPDALALMPSP